MYVINLSPKARMTFEIDSSVLGYEYITTADNDFFVAELFSNDEESAVRETYNTLFDAFKDDYKRLTELVMVLNWRHFAHYEKGNIELFKVYQELYLKLHEYCLDNLKDEAVEYYLNTTD